MRLQWLQAYKQMPWRSQIKWSSRILTILIFSAMVIGLYLSVCAQAASIGLDIQKSEITKDDLESEIADLRSQLALLTSEREMEKRARDLGYGFSDLSNALYVAVPGYTDPQPANLAEPYTLQIIARPMVKPGYTQSLWDWLSRNTLQVENLPQGNRS